MIVLGRRSSRNPLSILLLPPHPANSPLSKDKMVTKNNSVVAVISDFRKHLAEMACNSPETLWPPKTLPSKKFLIMFVDDDDDDDDDDSGGCEVVTLQRNQ